MELAFIIGLTTISLLSLWLFTPFVILLRRLQGYKPIRVTSIDGFRINRVLITKDGKTAHDPQWSDCYNFDLFEDGFAKFDTLDFIHAKWEYI